MSALEDPTATFRAVCEELKALEQHRPSLALGEGLSPKGAQTLKTILDAAYLVFVQDGHARLSMRRVASEAGIAVGNLNYYFRSKDDLLEAMLRETLANFIGEHIRQLTDNEHDPSEALVDIVSFYVADGRKSYPFFLQLWGYAGADTKARDLVRDLYRSIGRLVRQLIQIANPDISEEKATLAAVRIFSLEEGLKLLTGLEDGRSPFQDPENLAREITSEILQSP